VAAVLAIAVATWHLTTREVGDHVYDTGVGEFRLVVLPDQSRMMLNTGTRARVAYRGSVRFISLEHGEATFNVVHDISRPFEVHTGNVIARALGTEFDVQSSSGTITVSVLSGTVQVIRSFGEEIGSADLHSDVVRGGEAVMYRAHEPSDIRPADVGRIKAWRARRVQFDNVTLEKALVEYNRYLRTPIKIGDPAIADLHISGVFRVDDPEGLLRTLQEAFGMRIDRQGNAITLLPQVPSSPGG
jgi:transmembrane sensor